MPDLLSSLRASQEAWSTRGPVMVLGDIMLDEFYYATDAQRHQHALYREHNFFEVLSPKQISHLPGGAARLAANLAMLGLDTKLLSVFGAEPSADILSRALSRLGVDTAFILADQARLTTRKLRIVSPNDESSSRPLLRLDIESRDDLHGKVLQEFLTQIKATVPSAGAIVLDDYAKGILSTPVIDLIYRLAQKHEIPVHLRPRRSLQRYLHGPIAFESLFFNLQESKTLLSMLNISAASIANIEASTLFYETLLELQIHFRRLMILGRDDGDRIGNSLLFTPEQAGDSLASFLLQVPTELDDRDLPSNVGFNSAAFSGLIYGSGVPNAHKDAQLIATLCAHVHASRSPAHFPSHIDLLESKASRSLLNVSSKRRSISNRWISELRSVIGHVGTTYAPPVLVPAVYGEPGYELDAFLKDIEPLLQDHSSFLIYGESGSGKTYVLENLIAHLKLGIMKATAPSVSDIPKLLDAFARSSDDVLILDEFLDAEDRFRPVLSKLPEGILILDGNHLALRNKAIVAIGSKKKDQISRDALSRFSDRAIEFPPINRSPRKLVIDFLCTCAGLEGNGVPVACRQLLALACAAHDPKVQMSRRLFTGWFADISNGRSPHAWDKYIQRADELADKFGVRNQAVIIERP